jgi:hypothetical protein
MKTALQTDAAIQLAGNSGLRHCVNLPRGVELASPLAYPFLEPGSTSALASESEPIINGSQRSWTQLRYALVMCGAPMLWRFGFVRWIT